jgi:hypothetical protein
MNSLKEKEIKEKINGLTFSFTNSLRFQFYVKLNLNNFFNYLILYKNKILIYLNNFNISYGIN